MMDYSEALGLRVGFLVTNPIPAEHEIPHEKSDAIIDAAGKEADERNSKAKIAPFY